VAGARIVTELRGIRALPLELNPPPKYSITCSRSFGDRIQKKQDLREAIAYFLSTAAEKMRRHNLAANSITVFISTSRFGTDVEYYSNAATHSSAYPSDVNYELQRWAFDCLNSIFKIGYSYKKAGIILGGLVPSDILTTRMFDDERWQRFRNVMRAVDEINRKFGRNTVRLCVAKPAGAWSGKAARLSQRYTTRFNEILCIR
jgi:DNA polymerase V